MIPLELRIELAQTVLPRPPNSVPLSFPDHHLSVTRAFFDIVEFFFCENVKINAKKPLIGFLLLIFFLISTIVETLVTLIPLTFFKANHCHLK